jgi:hypothetical protein
MLSVEAEDGEGSMDERHIATEVRDDVRFDNE